MHVFAFFSLQESFALAFQGTSSTEAFAFAPKTTLLEVEVAAVRYELGRGDNEHVVEAKPAPRSPRHANSKTVRPAARNAAEAALPRFR